MVVTELCTTGETPDALGWRGTHSTLIECKTSRADFVADQKKEFRRCPSLGVGNRRYYMAPKGLLDVRDLPDNWGLLEVWPDVDCDGDGAVCVTRESQHFDAHDKHEVGILLSTLRRVGHGAPRTVSIKCYTIGSKNVATLGLTAPDDHPYQIQGDPAA